jgi:Zn-dependent M16 (insulinase) family peptidase
MDQELIAYLDEKFRRASLEVNEQIQAFRQETAQRFQEISGRIDGLEAKLSEENRLTRVLVEGLRSDLKLLAKAVIGLSERRTEHENAMEFKMDQVKSSIEPYYRNLNRRVSLLEGVDSRRDRDVMDVIREKFEKKR